MSEGGNSSALSNSRSRSVALDADCSRINCIESERGLANGVVMFDVLSCSLVRRRELSPLVPFGALSASDLVRPLRGLSACSAFSPECVRSLESVATRLMNALSVRAMCLALASRVCRLHSAQSLSSGIITALRIRQLCASRYMATWSLTSALSRNASSSRSRIIPGSCFRSASVAAFAYRSARN